MKPTNSVAKLFSSVSTLAVVASAVALSSVAMGQGGQVVAWGNNGNGQCNVPVAAQSGVSAIAGAGSCTLALKDGAILDWGLFVTSIPVAAQSGVSAIAGQDVHMIALQSGAVLAWGENDYGQCLGTNTSGSPITSLHSITISGAYVQINGVTLSGVTSIACGIYHSIALKDGAVLAWGAGTTNSGNWPEYGQSIVPTAAQSGVTAIAGGTGHTIALKDGKVLAWGYNNSGQCDIPTAAQSGVTAIGGGANFTVALKGGAVLAWGSNYGGQCTIPLAATSGVTAIACSSGNCVALKNGGVLVWGDNGSNQCTIPLAATSGVIAIAMGNSHIIALKGPPVTITGVLPISGPSSGGTNITITGTNFESPATVTIGGIPATNVVVVSDTQITATTPAGFPGLAVVAVNLGSSTAFYYRPSCGSDVDNNGVVDSGGLSIVLLDFGSCSESSAVAQQQEPLILQTAEPLKPVAVKK